MNAPPRPVVPIVQHLTSAYKLWHSFTPHMPKDTRYSLGAKIDAVFIDVIETVFSAGYLPKEKKLPFLERASAKLDVLKFLLQLAWEIKALDNKKYLDLSEPLNDIGRMLGGWQRQIASRSAEHA